MGFAHPSYAEAFTMQLCMNLYVPSARTALRKGGRSTGDSLAGAGDLVSCQGLQSALLAGIDTYLGVLSRVLGAYVRSKRRADNVASTTRMPHQFIRYSDCRESLIYLYRLLHRTTRYRYSIEDLVPRMAYPGRHCRYGGSTSCDMAGASEMGFEPRP